MIDVAKALLANARIKRTGIEFRSARSGDIVRNCADITRANELFGYHPTTGLEDGLGRTMGWFRSYAAA